MDVPRQHKRLRRINAGATSGNSNKSDNEIQEFDVGNISEEETEEEIPGGGILEPAETHCVSSKTKCWLFLKSLTKVLKIKF